MRNHLRRVRASRMRGFTLIELLAVMAILAVLAAMVAPAVSGTKEASVDSKVLADANQVRSATTDYFRSRTGSEVRSPHTITTTTLVSSVAGQTEAAAATAAVGNVKQEISDRWPELYITEGTAPPDIRHKDSTGTAIGFDDQSVYSPIFATTTDPVVKTIILLDKDDRTITGTRILTGFTAIDVEVLATLNFLSAIPDGARDVSVTSGVPIANFLWLFQKKSSVGGKDDDRAVVVFKLIKVEKLESETTIVGALQKVKLTYKQVF